jgi:hypothetical protein
MRIPRLPWFVWTLIAAWAALGIVVQVQWSSSGFLRPVQITAGDMAPIPPPPGSLHQPVKLVWSFPGESYVRAVLEERDARNGPWREIGSYPWRNVCDRATLIYQLNMQPNPTSFDCTLELRFGCTRTLAGGFKEPVWNGYVVPLRLHGSGYAAESNPFASERFFQITGGDRSYRLRLERGAQPFTTVLAAVR